MYSTLPNRRESGTSRGELMSKALDLRIRRIAPLAAAISAALAAASAQAQQLEEIIVTAERRETSLQDTPISVATFSAEAMELKGLETLEDVANFTPNLDIKGSRGNGNISPTY